MKNYNRRINVSAVLIGSLLTATFAQAQGKRISVKIQQPDRNVELFAEYDNVKGEYCNGQLKYIIRIKGTLLKNSVFRWKLSHVPCDGPKQVYKEIKVQFYKGSGTRSITFPIATKNLITLFEEGTFKADIVEDPVFDVPETVNSLEGDDVQLRINPVSALPGTVWRWAKENPLSVVQTGGTVLNDKLFKKTKYYVWGETEGFRSEMKQINVSVKMRPAAPSGFTILCPEKETTDMMPVELEVNPNSSLDKVIWVWTMNGEEIGRGLKLKVNPASTAVYSVHSEYYHKRSVSKSCKVNVRYIKPPPDNFEITGPERIVEGQPATLKILNRGALQGVKWVWSDGRRNVTADSLVVYPVETTVYKLYADNEGKKSVVKSIKIIVIQLPRSPVVNGSRSRCITSDIPNQFDLSGGKLGTGSEEWAWYEGKCGTGNLIKKGEKISLRPARTTTYHVRPDNNKDACTEFTIEVGEVPELPDMLTAPALVCQDEQFTVEAAGNPQPGTTWTWFVQEPGSSKAINAGQGKQITDAIRNDRIYLVGAENKYCTSAGYKSVRVNTRPAVATPYSIRESLERNKKRSYLLTASGKLLPMGARFVWYKNSCGGEPLGQGETIRYRAERNNSLFVRVEGVCDTSACANISFVHKNKVFRFFFLNTGLAANKLHTSIFDYNAHISLGTNRFYIMLKAPLSLIFTDSVAQLIDVAQKLETDNSRITNYPANNNTYYVFNGRTADEVYAASAGVLLGGKTFKLYVGGGYGQRKLYWNAAIYEYGSNSYKGTTRALNTVQSINGPLAEGGIMLRLGAVNISGGVSMIIGPGSKMYRDVQAGIGFNINQGLK